MRPLSRRLILLHCRRPALTLDELLLLLWPNLPSIAPHDAQTAIDYARQLAARLGVPIGQALP